MFEQFLMYWLLWLLFIIIFFFMEKSKKRTMLTIWLLFIITFSSTYMNIHIAQVSLSMIIIIFGAFIYLSEAPFSFLPLFKAFTIMIFYCGLLLWLVVAQVWFFLFGYFMFPVLFFFFFFFFTFILSFYDYDFLLWTFTLAGCCSGMVFFIRIFYDSCSSCLSFDSFIQTATKCLRLYFTRNIFWTTFI